MRTTQEWDQLSGLVTLWSQQAKQAGENGDRMARAAYWTAICTLLETTSMETAKEALASVVAQSAERVFKRNESQDTYHDTLVKCLKDFNGGDTNHAK